MKFSFSTFLFALALAFAPQAAAQKTRVENKVRTQTTTETRTQTERTERETEREAERQERERERAERERQHEHADSAPVERTSAASAQAVVTLCLSQGDVLVRGWDKTEVRARAEGAGNVRLLTPNDPPASRVEVLVTEDEGEEPGSGDCGSAEQVELMVPRGATVNVRTHNGHVDLSDISDARVETLSGDVDARRITKALQVSCLNGDVSLSDISGPVRAVTVSGSIEARNVRGLSAGDGFEAKSTSGDVTIENVKHTQVSGAAVSGDVIYTGALARGGAYDFKTISGDVTLEIPADSSFTLHAKVVVNGDIDTDFPVKTNAVGASAGPKSAPPVTAPPATAPPVTAPTPPEPSHWPQPPTAVRVKPGKMKQPFGPEQVHLDGAVGSGDATVNLSSFSGSLHLRKQ